MHKVNIGCGRIFIDTPDWLNLDFSPVSSAVRKANLLDRLPIGDGTASLVYSSHFLEHVPRSRVKHVLEECWRVLRLGGVLRLVLPDLENMAREYLAKRDQGEHQKADFVVLEMIDQCVRRVSGGELGRLYRQLSARSDESVEPLIEYIRIRTGEKLGAPPSKKVEGHYMWRALQSRMEQTWIRLVCRLLPTAFRIQNVSLTSVGEQHHWLWDFYQLKAVLECSGFVDVQRHGPNSSAVTDFPFHPLDLDEDGWPRKGAESML